MFGVIRPRYQGRVEAGGSPQGAGPVKAEHKRGAPPAVSPRPERSPGPASPHQRSRVTDKAPTFVGIDVSKDRLDVHARPSGESLTVDHDEEGVAALVERLAALAPTLVVLEATGGMEVRLAAALAGRGHPAPRRPRGAPPPAARDARGGAQPAPGRGARLARGDRRPPAL